MAGAAVAKGGFDVLVSRRAAQDRRVHRPVAARRPRPRHDPHDRPCSGLVHRYRNVERLNRGFRRGQLVSAAAFSLGHGGNDAQKTMGIILAVLISAGHLPTDADVPLWVVLAAHIAIGLGTLSGGWRIVKTMGSKITRLQPVGGVAAETAAAATLFFTSAAGIPVSTTHTITGAIVGVGASPPPLGRALGRRRPGRVGVDPHDPRRLGRSPPRPTYLIVAVRQLMDRRAAFFLVASAHRRSRLTPVADPEHRWVAVAVGVTYLVLAARLGARQAEPRQGPTPVHRAVGSFDHHGGARRSGTRRASHVRPSTPSTRRSTSSSPW